jgi:hypothetical protein
MPKTDEIPVMLWKSTGEDFILTHCNSAVKDKYSGTVTDIVGKTLTSLINGQSDIADDFQECYQSRSSFLRARCVKFVDQTQSADVSVLYSFIPTDCVVLALCEDAEHHAENTDLTASREFAKFRTALQEKDIAVRQLMSQISSEREIIKKNIQINLNYAVLPLLKNLKSKSDRRLHRDIELIEEAIACATSQFIGDLQSEFVQLSPRELQVCNMIKSGMQSKEIAVALSISVRTVEKTRQQIRKKLGLTNSGSGLPSFLNSYRIEE